MTDNSNNGTEENRIKRISRGSDEWLNRYWRPMMAVTYMVIIIFDFMVAPVFWSLLQYKAAAGVVTTAWTPLTLQGGGLFHLAMGAILSVSAFTRGNEKIERLRSGLS